MGLKPLSQVRQRVVLVDLNNFATFPTLAVGLLVASLRSAGYDAQVICPLSHDVPASERERPEHFFDHVHRKLRLTTLPTVHAARELTRRMRAWWAGRPHRRVLRTTASVLSTKPDVMLLSAYLQHYHTVRKLCMLAQRRGVPVILGGPVFNHEATANAWRSIPGLTALVGAEADLMLPQLVAAVISGQDLLAYRGVTLPDGRRSAPAEPLRNLDRIAVPDFTDFPWDRYRMRVIPIMTGRGCQWSKCTFCSDVVSANGRTFRTRGIESVIHEIRELSQRHSSVNFIFLDLKLNSQPALLRGIVENIQLYAPGAQWIGTVHVDGRSDNGLSRRELRAAAAAGMRRVSFGLESGSQRMLDAMRKGSTVAANSLFIRNAHEAGISVRCTMFKGFPGETADDLVATAEFLEAHVDQIDRVRFNEFALPEGTPIYHAVKQTPAALPALRVEGQDYRNSMLRHVNVECHGRAYRRALARVLRVVYAINRRPVKRTARAFDGMM
ncbi:MAG: radical SAM protein [Gammaproteobacteria bacterium]|nr:radical SAM protein [Gammaproteobacteria bacterium]